MVDRESGRLGRSWGILFLLAMGGVALVMLAGRPPGILTALLLLGVAKSRLIVLDFMGFRNGPAVLRRGLLAWAIGLALAAIGKLFLAGAIG